MGKKTSKCCLDTNFVIDACAAGILAEFRAHAEMHGWDIVIPGEVYREAIGDEMSEFLDSMSLDAGRTVAEFPPLPEKDWTDTTGQKMRGLGEDHIIVIAQWFRANGEKVLVITSDKKAQKRLEVLKITSLRIHDVVLRLNHSSLLPKERALSAIARLEQSRNVMRPGEKDALVRQLR